MKVVIIADIHGNFDALSAFSENYDELWVLGDLVNYGPQPAEVIDFIRNRATYVVRGNHDHSIGFGEDPRCSPRFREMAEATRRFTDMVLNDEDKSYLRNLPLHVDAWAGKTRFRLCHAVPSDPLYAYYMPDDERWEEECRQAGTGILLVGHTHIPFSRKIGNMLLANPGSLGQPKSGDPAASYAVLEDGKLSLHSFHYPLENTVKKIRAMPIPAAVQDDLIAVLRTGSVPQEWSETAYVKNRRA